jgi:hypothetical protein
MILVVYQMNLMNKEQKKKMIKMLTAILFPRTTERSPAQQNISYKGLARINCNSETLETIGFEANMSSFKCSRTRFLHISTFSTTCSFPAGDHIHAIIPKHDYYKQKRKKNGT